MANGSRRPVFAASAPPPSTERSSAAFTVALRELAA
jgi:hypothetical protein